MTSDKTAGSDSNEQHPDDIMGIGAGRRKTLEAVKAQSTLSDVSGPFESIGDLEAALEDLGLSWKGWTYSTPPKGLITTARTTFENLPEDAQDHFLADEILRTRINRARSRYNKYCSRLEKRSEMPSVVEAGPSKYPHSKADRLLEQYHSAREALDEAIGDVESAVSGARQRALEKIGSSVAEQNQKAQEQKREQMRDLLDEGDIVEYRSPRLHVGAVLRVNKKSVTLRRPNPRAGQTKPLSDEPEPETIDDRVDLDSEHLSLLSHGDLLEREDLPDARDEAQAYLLGNDDD